LSKEERKSLILAAQEEIRQFKVQVRELKAKIKALGDEKKGAEKVLESITKAIGAQTAKIAELKA
jgi:hypothetical protein